MTKMYIEWWVCDCGECCSSSRLDYWMFYFESKSFCVVKVIPMKLQKN